MKFVGVDLHKQTITLCVVDQSRTILERKRLACANESSSVEFFENLGEFRAVVEATASYEWFVRLIEPFAEKVLLAHRKKLRVIAESTRKSDKLDAQVLAEFLALDMIPTSYRPTPRQRDHRRLVRQRDSIQRRITSVKNRMRRMMSHDRQFLPTRRRIPQDKSNSTVTRGRPRPRPGWRSGASTIDRMNGASLACRKLETVPC